MSEKDKNKLEKAFTDSFTLVTHNNEGINKKMDDIIRILDQDRQQSQQAPQESTITNQKK